MPSALLVCRPIRLGAVHMSIYKYKYIYLNTLSDSNKQNMIRFLSRAGITVGFGGLCNAILTGFGRLLNTFASQFTDMKDQRIVVA